MPSCAVGTQQRYLDRLIIRRDGRIVFLDTREIEWIQADDKYVHFHTARGRCMVRKTLNAIQSELDPNRFVRIHRSAIINVDRIKELQPSFSGKHAVLMENGARLILSRKYKDRLFDLLGKPL